MIMIIIIIITIKYSSRKVHQKMYKKLRNQQLWISLVNTWAYVMKLVIYYCFLYDVMWNHHHYLNSCFEVWPVIIIIIIIIIYFYNHHHYYHLIIIISFIIIISIIIIITIIISIIIITIINIIYNRQYA